MVATPRLLAFAIAPLMESPWGQCSLDHDWYHAHSQVGTPLRLQGDHCVPPVRQNTGPDSPQGTRHAVMQPHRASDTGQGSQCLRHSVTRAARQLATAAHEPRQILHLCHELTLKAIKSNESLHGTSPKTHHEAQHIIPTMEAQAAASAHLRDCSATPQVQAVEVGNCAYLRKFQ